MLSEPVATALVWLVLGYLAIGVPLALAFVARGVARVDPAAADGTWGFRVLIFPGCIALWPLVILRWRRGGPPPAERNAHRDAAARTSSA